MQATENCSDASTQCKNTGGSYFCECRRGYQPFDQTQTEEDLLRTQVACADIDECNEFPEVREGLLIGSCLLSLRLLAVSSCATKTPRASMYQEVSRVRATRDTDPLALAAMVKIVND